MEHLISIIDEMKAAPKKPSEGTKQIRVGKVWRTIDRLKLRRLEYQKEYDRMLSIYGPKDMGVILWRVRVEDIDSIIEEMENEFEYRK